MNERSENVVRATEERIPAFKEQIFPALGGLTRRELFAAMAMQGIISSLDTNVPADEVASVSVMMADALLKELAK